MARGGSGPSARQRRNSSRSSIRHAVRQRQSSAAAEGSGSEGPGAEGSGSGDSDGGGDEDDPADSDFEPQVEESAAAAAAAAVPVSERKQQDGDTPPGGSAGEGIGRSLHVRSTAAVTHEYMLDSCIPLQLPMTAPTVLGLWCWVSWSNSRTP
jgi:hypothetical protein